MSALRRVLRRTAARARRRLSRRDRASTRHALVGPASLWAEKRQFQFEFLVAHGLRREHRLLDIGCGTLRGGIPLIDYLEAGHYFGIEPRKEALDEAYKELAETGLEGKSPTLINTAEPGDVRIGVPIDFAWAYSVLIHMPDEVVDAYMGLVAGILSERGAYYANVIIGDGPQESWREFPVVPRTLAQYERMAARHGLQLAELGTLKALGYPKDSPSGHGTMLQFTPADGR